MSCAPASLIAAIDIATVVVGGGPNQSYGPPNLLYTVTP